MSIWTYLLLVWLAGSNLYIMRCRRLLKKRSTSFAITIQRDGVTVARAAADDPTQEWMRGYYAGRLDPVNTMYGCVSKELKLELERDARDCYEREQRLGGNNE